MVNNFQIHMLIIITTWMLRFPKGGLQMPWYLISQNAEKLLLWWIMPNIIGGLFEILQQYTWEKTIRYDTNTISTTGKSVLLQKFRDANISKKFEFDEVVLNTGYSALRLRLYYYLLNPNKMVRSQLKNHARRWKIYRS